MKSDYIQLSQILLHTLLDSLRSDGGRKINHHGKIIQVGKEADNIEDDSTRKMKEHAGEESSTQKRAMKNHILPMESLTPVEVSYYVF